MFLGLGDVSKRQAQVRRFLSYMPSSVDELTGRAENEDPPDLRADSPPGVVPRSPLRASDPRSRNAAVVDLSLIPLRRC